MGLMEFWWIGHHEDLQIPGVGASLGYPTPGVWNMAIFNDLVIFKDF